MTTIEGNPSIKNSNSVNIEHIETSENIEIKQLFFHDEYLIEETDKKLIDVDKVENNVRRMIDNYKSTEYANYNKILNKLPKIFGKKTFKIEYKRESIKVHKFKKDGDTQLLHNIVKPVINDIIDFEEKLHNINHSRKVLKNKYLEYITEDNISLADKNKFIKDKTSFIELLENYYTHKNYYMIINNLVGSNNYTNISISNYQPFINSKGEYDNQLYVSQYKINPEVIEEINENKIKSLDKFNDIKENIELNNKKELNDLIKKYLDKEDTEINKKINQVIKEQNEEILYIIDRLPKIDSDLNKYLE
jgi:hypothetical protein